MTAAPEVEDFEVGFVTQELEVLSNYRSEIEQAADPAKYVIQACERAKAWLANVLEHGDIDQIVELKSRAEAIRAMSKQLGKDAELSAAEIVRRAERGIGLAIRRGQANGEIRKHGGPSPLPTRPYERVRGGVRETVQPPEPAVLHENLRSVKAFFGGGQLAVDTYAMTDGVTDEQFDKAIGTARAEGDLSRRNVVRKVRGEPGSPVQRPVIQAVSAQHKALNAATVALSGITHGLAQITDLHPDITCDEAAQWVDGLSESRLVLEQLIKRLRARIAEGNHA